MSTFSPDRTKTAEVLLEQSWRELLERLKLAGEARDRVREDPSSALDPWIDTQIQWQVIFEPEIAAIQDVYEASDKLDPKYLAAARGAADRLVRAYDEARQSLQAA